LLLLRAAVGAVLAALLPRAVLLPGRASPVTVSLAGSRSGRLLLLVLLLLGRRRRLHGSGRWRPGSSRRRLLGDRRVLLGFGLADDVVGVVTVEHRPGVEAGDYCRHVARRSSLRPDRSIR
jgi:hypothetical protein